MKNISFLFLLIFNIFSYAQPTSFLPRGHGGSGAVFAMSINPANDNEFYVACDMGQMFHTTDYGLHYNQINTNELITSIKSKVCYTATTNLLYSIEQPENYFPVPTKSTDNGNTWTPLVGNPAPNNYTQIYVTHSINVDYNNANRVLISHRNKVYFSSDGGTTFSLIHTAIDLTRGIIVSGVLFDNNKIYIGTNDGILTSINGGTSFAIATISGIPANEMIWSFTAAKVGAITRFYCITADPNIISIDMNIVDNVNFAKGVYSVDYGVGNWVSKTNGLNLTTDYLMHIDMAQNDINTVYIAGSNQWPDPRIFKTTNAGSSWQNVLLTPNNENVITGWLGQNGISGWGASYRPFDFDVCSTNANKVIFGGFSGVHKTENGGVMWQQAYTDAADQHPANAPTPAGTLYHSIGFENTSCWQIHWIDQNNMWSCFTDLFGIKSPDAGNSWSHSLNTTTLYNGGETYRIVQHPTNGKLFAAAARIHDIYEVHYAQDYQIDPIDPDGKIVYSSDNGLHWSVLKQFNHPVYWIALDPNNSNRAYVSVVNAGTIDNTIAGGIYMTNDLQNLTSATWILLPNPPRTEGHPASIVVLNDGKMVCSYSVRVDYNVGIDGGTYTPSSGVFLYDPTTNLWQDKSDAGMYYYTKDVVVDPNDSTQNTWYAGVFSGGWGTNPANNLGGLYKTTNRGTTWIKILADKNVESCTINPNNANQLYVTTQTDGLWLSQNINAVLPTFSVVDSYDFWHPTRVFFNPYNTNEMWVASFGNGMKVGNLAPLSVSENTIENSKFSIYPNPSSDLIKIQFTSSDKETIEIYNYLGQKIKEILVSNNSKIDVSDLSNGVYFVKMKDSQYQSIKFIKE